MMTVPLLEIQNATKVYGGGFLSSAGRMVALQNVSITLPGEKAMIVTIAGESGSGKTTLANAVLGFTHLTSGRVLYKGRDVNGFEGSDLKDYRREVQAVFQDPYEVYNPFYRVKHIFNMVLKNLNSRHSKTESREIIEDALRVVGLRGEEVLGRHPHQLSGGQRQRIMMARAYMIKPRLIVADEPVSAVDASLRAMILDVMIRLRDEAGISFLYITHDLSTAYQIGDEIIILYQGSIAECGLTGDVIGTPGHPYVRMLINSVPVPDPKVKWSSELEGVADESLRNDIHSGCRFYPRCPERMDRCLDSHPRLYPLGNGSHKAACYLFEVDNEYSTQDRFH